MIMHTCRDRLRAQRLFSPVGSRLRRRRTSAFGLAAEISSVCAGVLVPTPSLPVWVSSTSCAPSKAVLAYLPKPILPDDPDPAQ